MEIDTQRPRAGDSFLCNEQHVLPESGSSTETGRGTALSLLEKREVTQDRRDGKVARMQGQRGPRVFSDKLTCLALGTICSDCTLRSVTLLDHSVIRSRAFFPPATSGAPIDGHLIHTPPNRPSVCDYSLSCPAQGRSPLWLSRQGNLLRQGHFTNCPA